MAGNGTPAYSGDGGLATSARLNGPVGVAVDAGGNLHIADTGNCRIRKVAATTGIITTLAGNGTITACGHNRIACPIGIAEWHPNFLAS